MPAARYNRNMNINKSTLQALPVAEVFELQAVLTKVYEDINNSTEARAAAAADLRKVDAYLADLFN